MNKSREDMSIPFYLYLLITYPCVLNVVESVVDGVLRLMQVDAMREEERIDIVSRGMYITD